ncbi:MAG: hypothetical protein IKS03_05830 [Ruminococcus sp.]|nr:hypothetical protein [Ruminococcus sp.]
MKNHTCEHCGAIVKGDVCEYCGCPAEEKPAPKIEYKQDTKKSSPAKKTIAVSVLIFIAVISAVTIKVNVNSTKKESAKYKFELSRDEMPKIEVPDIKIPEIKVPETEIPNAEKPVFSKADITGESGVYPSGTYQIGVDIPEGKYLLISDMMYEDELPTFPYGIYTDPFAEHEIWFSWGEFSEYAVIEGEGYVSFTWATAYDIEKSDVINDPFSRSGTFLVGRDLPAGTYEIVSTSDDGHAYYSILSDIYKTSQNVLMSGNIDSKTETKEITVEDGQYLSLSWAKLKK